MLTRIALAQLAVNPGKLETNFSRGLELITAAASSGSHYVLFPELWTSGYPIRSPHKTSKMNAEFIEQLRMISAGKNIVIGGSFLMEESQSFYNRYLLIAPDSQPPLVYDKIHLFKPLKEDHMLKGGNNLARKNVNDAAIGLAICYDLRFPELFRAYRVENVNLFLLAAEWPLSRIGHWKVLIQARAIENQSFFAAVNCVGKTAIEKFGGSSMLVDPYGNVVCSGNETDECLLTVDCDLSAADTCRKNFPVLESHRKDLFTIHQR